MHTKVVGFDTFQELWRILHLRRYLLRCLLVSTMIMIFLMIICFLVYRYIFWIVHWENRWPMVRRQHRFWIGVSSHSNEHGFYPRSGGFIFQDDPFYSLLEDNGYHLDYSLIYLGDCPHAQGFKIYYIKPRYKIHEQFLKESVGKNGDQA
jgi:hypothetical protein